MAASLPEEQEEEAGAEEERLALAAHCRLLTLCPAANAAIWGVSKHPHDRR